MPLKIPFWSNQSALLIEPNFGSRITKAYEVLALILLGISNIRTMLFS